MNKVSVIIPCYNAGKYIFECIDSILKQSYENIEIVVVDSSTDGSSDEIQNLSLNSVNGRIKYFFQDKRGPAAARNFGIDNSTGDFLAFLDSDDIFSEESIELKINLFENDKDVSLVFSDAYIMNEDELMDYKYKNVVGKFYDGYPFEKLIENNFICTSTVIVKKDVIEKAGKFNEDFKNAEDYEFWLRICKNKFKIGYVDKPLTYYRIRKGSLSDNNLKNTEYLIHLFENLNIDKDNYSDKEISLIQSNINRFYCDRSIIIAKNFINEGKYYEAYNEYLKIHDFKKLSIKYYTVLFLLKTFPGIIRYFLKKRKNHRGI